MATHRTSPGAIVSRVVDELRREVDRLIRQVRHWAAPRWAATASGSPQRSRAELVHELLQRLADRCASAEGEPRRPVPRLDSDLALVDQLRVISADLFAAAPPADVLTSAARDVAEVRGML
jgi:hypothetical protein